MSFKADLDGEEIFFLLTNKKDVVLVVGPLYLPLFVLFISPSWCLLSIAWQLFTGRNVKIRKITGATLKTFSWVTYTEHWEE